VTIAADEDEGPWTQPLPLGVYRIVSRKTPEGSSPSGSGSFVKQLPLYDASDSDSTIIDFLVCNQCLEIVETQVLVMKDTSSENCDDYGCQHGKEEEDGPLLLNRKKDSFHTKSKGRRVVRARCMVPVIVSPLSVENFIHGNGAGGTPVVPRRKFQSGWITIHREGKDERSPAVTAVPIAIGAYIVTTNDPLLSCDSNSKIKSILPSGSCMEVNATRIEFEENEEQMKCRYCSRESMYHTVAVRALIASGGYVTLFVVSVGVSGTHGSLCACGRLVQQTYAEPVPLGVYRIVHPALLTRGSGHQSPVMMRFHENDLVRVVETRVEGGCVRGHVDLVQTVDRGNSKGRKETISGWVSLFEPPSFSWAELSANVKI